MRNCDLLKKFYEEQSVLVSIVDNLVLDCAKKGSVSHSNMGGKNGSLGYRLICTDNSVSIEITSDDFAFCFLEQYNDEKYDRVLFDCSDTVSAVEFGNVINENKFLLSDSYTNSKFMDYPIQEEQYFQYLTIFDLNSVELYNYFMDIKKNHTCVLEISDLNGSGFENFEKVLQDSSTMKKIQDDIKMVEFALRRTQGL